jgi:hypothetical protein
MRVGPASSFPLSPEEREGCEARVEGVRVRSREFVADCMRLRGDAEIQERFVHARGHYYEAEDALRDSVREFVGLLRRLGKSPEDAVIAVKELIRDASADFLQSPRYAERDLTADVVLWAIDGYFAAE